MFSPKAPPTPAVVDDDEVVPLDPHNSNWVLRSQLFNALWKYDQVLDPQVLKDGLSRLLELPGWRNMGARLRKNPQGHYEYHIPRAYSAARPAFAWTEEHHPDTSIRDHADGALIPSPSSCPAVVSDAADYASLRFAAHAPQKFADFLASDAPQLTVRVVVFRDATTISVMWLHTLMDAMGRSDFLKAWSAMVHNRPDLVPAAIEHNPMAGFGADASVKDYLLYSYIVQGVAYFLLALRLIWALLTIKDGSAKNICIPKSAVDAWRTQALADLAAAYPDEKLFVSDGDVIAAWMTKLALGQDPTLSKPHLVVCQAYSLRRVLAQDRIPAGAAYIGNAVGGIFAMMDVHAVLTKPLAWTALQYRNAIKEQGSRAEQERLFKYDQANIQRGYPTAIGTRDSHVLGFTNWTRAGMYNLDFSAAVVGDDAAAGSSDAAEKTTGIPRGLPSFVTASRRGDRGYNGWIVTGQDAAGNYWINAAFRKRSWVGIMRALDLLRY